MESETAEHITFKVRNQRSERRKSEPIEDKCALWSEYSNNLIILIIVMNSKIGQRQKVLAP